MPRHKSYFLFLLKNKEGLQSVKKFSVGVTGLLMFCSLHRCACDRKVCCEHIPFCEMKDAVSAKKTCLIFEKGRAIFIAAFPSNCELEKIGKSFTWCGTTLTWKVLWAVECDLEVWLHLQLLVYPSSMFHGLHWTGESPSLLSLKSTSLY